MSNPDPSRARGILYCPLALYSHQVQQRGWRKRLVPFAKLASPAAQNFVVIL